MDFPIICIYIYILYIYIYIHIKLMIYPLNLGNLHMKDLKAFDSVLNAPKLKPWTRPAKKARCRKGLKKSRYWKQWWMRTWAIFTGQIIIWLHTYMVVLLPKPCWKGTISITALATRPGWLYMLAIVPAKLKQRNDIYRYLSISIISYNFNTTPCVPESNNPIGRVDEMLAVRSRSQKARLDNPRHQGYLAVMKHGWLGNPP